MTKLPSLRDLSFAHLDVLTRHSGALDLLLNTAPGAIGPEQIERIGNLLSEALVEKARAEPCFRALAENPALFRGAPGDGLSEWWALRGRWIALVAKVAAQAEAAAVVNRGAIEAWRSKTQADAKRAAPPGSSDWIHVLARVVREVSRRPPDGARGKVPVPQADVLAAPAMALSIPGRRVDASKPAALIARSGLFDESYYRFQVQGELEPDGNLIEHYVVHGWQAGLDPNPLFSVRYYLRQEPGLAQRGVEPLGHYIAAGSAPGADPHPLFLSSYYAAAAAIGPAHKTTLLSHFLEGGGESISPHPLFDARFYAAQAKLEQARPDVALLHYLVKGWRRELPFGPLFNPSFYREHYAGSIASEPYAHYVLHGVSKRLSPHPLFDLDYYVSQAQGWNRFNDPYVHYLMEGESKGLAPSPFFDPAYYSAQYRAGLGDSGALEQFCREGDAADHRPFRHFDPIRYRSVFMPGRCGSAIEHFVTQGMLEFTEARIEQITGRHTVASPGEAKPAKTAAARARSRPTPAVAEEAALKLNLKAFPGKRPFDAERPNVLLVAHAAAEMLFGSERSLLDMLEGLNAVPANVFVVLPRNVPAYTNAIRPSCQYVVTFKYDWWRAGTDVSSLARSVFVDLIKSFEISAVHVNTIMLRECVVAARECGIPTITHVREAIEHDRALADLIGKTPDEIIDEVCDRTDWIIGNSSYTARMFDKPGHTFTIPNTVDLDELDMPNEVKGNKIRFGLISSNIAKKGLLDLVELARAAIDTVPNAEFVLIGPPTQLVEELVARQKSGELPSNLTFLGYAATPREAISQVQVVLNFSHFAESFGRTVLEAMAARRPVIAYDWGALPELVRQGSTGFLVPYLSPRLALPFVEELCTTTGLIEQMGERGRIAAVARYGLHQYRQSFAKAYGAILDTQPLIIETPDGPVVRPARLSGIKEVDPAPRIAYFCWHFPVPSETFVLNELEVLVRDGIDVLVFCRQSPHKGFSAGFPIKHERVDSVATLSRRLHETGRTIVHAHFTYPTVTDMVWPACEQAGLPFTFIAHAQDIFRHDNDRKNRLAEISASPFCRAVFTLSDFHMAFLISRGVPAHKIIINPNAVDTSRFEKASVPDRAARKTRRVLAIHRFVAKKGLGLLIEAAGLLRDTDIRFELYGYGDLELEYRKMVDHLGLQNVRIGGPLSQDQIIEEMRDADLFACPSIRVDNGDMDGIPTSVIESMAAGLPVLSTRISGIPALVADEVTGIVCQPNPESIAEAIRRYYALPYASVSSMIVEARRRAIYQHDSVRLVRSLRRVWENRVVDILVVSWNGLHELRAVIDRIVRNTCPPYHLIVCDNQSRRENNAGFLDDLWASNDRVTVIHNNQNAMVGPGTNECLKYGKGEVAIYVCGKEGFSFSRGWENLFVHAFAENASSGLVGTVGRSPTYLTGEQYPRGIALFDKFRRKDFAAKNPTRVFGHIQGGLFGIRREMVDQIGNFSEAVPHDYTDVEYSFYAEACGWKLGEVPGVMALFNKSRPTLSQRIDETVAVAHPVLLHQIRKFDRLRRGSLSHCNMCDWFGTSFSPERICPGCSGSAEDRTLFRWLSEGIHMYRRLPALAIGLHGAMENLWREQFQGAILAPSELLNRIESAGRLANSDGAIRLSLVRVSDPASLGWAPVAKEFRRLCSGDSVLAVQFPASQPLPELSQFQDKFGAALGIARCEKVVYSSAALAFSHIPMLVWLKQH